MFPSELFALFPPFPSTNEVFIAISFAPEFAARLDNVIKPGVVDAGFQPHVVNFQVFADNIMTEICKRISQSALFFADVSPMPGYPPSPPVRNANVMYEVGLAHAVRMPQEVVLFRTDDERLPFDMNQVRVNRYDPDGDPREARAQIAAALRQVREEVDLRRSLTVTRVASQVDVAGHFLLMHATADPDHCVVVQQPRTLGDHVQWQRRAASLGTLLRLGCISVHRVQYTIEETLAEPSGTIPDKYRLTRLGFAVFEHIAEQEGWMKLFEQISADPSLKARLETLLSDKGK